MTGATAATTRGSRGQPLVVLAALLCGWLGLRVVLWQSPFPTLAPAWVAAGKRAQRSRGPAEPRPRAAPGKIVLVRARAVVPGPLDAANAGLLPPPWPTGTAADQPPPEPTAVVSPRQIVGQQLLLAAAFSHMELPPEIARYLAAPRDAAASPPALSDGLAGRPGSSLSGATRWSGDGWLMLRRDSAAPLTAGEPSYGRSQMGAVLRYRLAPSSPHRPIAYARATRALAGVPETEVAVGLAARPLAGVPLSVAAEVRAFDGAAGREVRPAAFAVTELPPAKLPLGLRGEAYVQAGYVGGRYATAFVDGQARVDAPVARLGRDGGLRAGGGVWGGAQKHAARLDIGPSATIAFRLGDARSRVALDYRVRVAGDAEPKSGPAVTISAGF